MDCKNSNTRRMVRRWTARDLCGKIRKATHSPHVLRTAQKQNSDRFQRNRVYRNPPRGKVAFSPRGPHAQKLLSKPERRPELSLCRISAVCELRILATAEDRQIVCSTAIRGALLCTGSRHTELRSVASLQPLHSSWPCTRHAPVYATPDANKGAQIHSKGAPRR